MCRSLLAVLLVPVLLVGCRREPIVVSETQRAVCRQDAEAAPTPQEGLQRQARCIAAAIEAARKPGAPAPTPPSQAPPAVPAAPPAPAPGFNRYLYCRVQQDDVKEAAARFTNASKPWMVASARLSPTSEAYLTAQRNYNAAVAELEALLPPEVRNGMDLLPTAVDAFSRCDREELEGATP